MRKNMNCVRWSSICYVGYSRGGPGVCLGDGQTEVGVPTQCGRGDALLRRIFSYVTVTCTTMLVVLMWHSRRGAGTRGLVFTADSYGMDRRRNSIFRQNLDISSRLQRNRLESAIDFIKILFLSIFSSFIHYYYSHLLYNLECTVNSV